MYQLKTTPEFGRGLYATKNIQKDQIIMQCEILVLSPEDTIKVNDTELKYYTFVYNETQDCLVLGLGEIFNHNDSANIGYELIDNFDDTRKLMQFYALSDIETNSQLFIDYNQDTVVKIDNYIEQKSLMG